MRDKLIEKLNIDPQDVESRSMGAGGEDIMMSAAARSKFPYSIECKNQERVNVYASYKQACANCGEHTPILIMKKNREDPLIVMDALTFIEIHRMILCT